MQYVSNCTSMFMCVQYRYLRCVQICVAPYEVSVLCRIQDVPEVFLGLHCCLYNRPYDNRSKLVFQHPVIMVCSETGVAVN